MALTDWELRPPDAQYYAPRTDYVRQGDLFTNVPLGYAWPADALGHDAGRRRFLSGPFEAGFGLLLTPTCSMTAQGAPGLYAHAIRTLAPVLPLERLVDEGVVKSAAIDDLRKHDHLVNYLYLPPVEAAEMPESLALIYAGITVHHDYLEDRRVAQLSETAAVHLKYKLTALYAGELFGHEDFSDVIQ